MLDCSEAGCTPFAAAIIAEMFSPELRGSAMGIYNFGIYFGYSMSYAFGNFLYEANIMGEVRPWINTSDSPMLNLQDLLLNSSPKLLTL